MIFCVKEDLLNCGCVVGEWTETDRSSGISLIMPSVAITSSACRHCALRPVYSFFPRLDSPSGPRPFHRWGFEITLRHTALGGTRLTGDLPVADTSTWQHTTLTTDRYLYPRRGSKPSVPASEWPQTDAFDRAATGIGLRLVRTRYQ
jgi:hypothetical protein